MTFIGEKDNVMVYPFPNVHWHKVCIIFTNDVKEIDLSRLICGLVMNTCIYRL